MNMTARKGLWAGPSATPEIIMTPIMGGSAEYLGWISEETGQAAAS
jgi:uncharacterized protein involved in tolerance to divalent cations